MLIPARLPKEANEPSDFPGFATARDPSAWPDRRRGLSNFLTWAFFLAEILAADVFFGKGASAADALDDPSKHPAGDTHSSGEVSLPDDWRSAGDDALPADANRLLDSEATPLDPHYSETAAMPPLDGIGSHEAALHDLAGGGGGGSSTSFSQDSAPLSSEPAELAIHAGEASSVAAAQGFDLGVGGDVFSMLDSGTAAALGLELNPLQFDLSLGANLLSGTSPDSSLDIKALGLDVHVETSLLSGLIGDLGSTGSELLGDTLGSPLSNLVEDATGLNFSGPADALHSLLGTVEGTLGETSAGLTNLGSGAGVFSTVGAVVAGALPDTTDALSIGHLSGVGTGESIVFPSLSQDQPIDSLFSGGQYTDYNLALQTPPSDGAGAAGAAESLATGTLDLVGVATDDLGLPGSEATGQAVDSTLADLASADHELLRGLSI